MILICHGAWDSRTDPASGVRVLSDKIRRLNLSQSVIEIDVKEQVNITPPLLEQEPNFWIGYSNGGNRVWDEYLKVLANCHDPNSPQIQAHFVFLDFVYYGLRQVFDRAPINLPTTVRDCLCFYRTRMAGAVPPYHSLIANPSGDLFQNIPVDADHGNLPADSEVHDKICGRISDVFGGKLPLAFHPALAPAVTAKQLLRTKVKTAAGRATKANRKKR